VQNSGINWGWALTPQPKEILPDGIQVFVDGVPIGNATCGFPRADIQSLFPGYKNTDTAVCHFTLDTTMYPNGVHSIAWVATDDASAADGIGSRFFMIQN